MGYVECDGVLRVGKFCSGDLCGDCSRIQLQMAINDWDRASVRVEKARLQAVFTEGFRSVIRWAARSAHGLRGTEPDDKRTNVIVAVRGVASTFDGDGQLPAGIGPRDEHLRLRIVRAKADY